MFVLQSIPTLHRNEGTNPRAEGSSSTTRGSVAEQIGVLQEQDRLLTRYLVDAVQSRSLDDVAALKRNKAEVRSEISRLQHSLR